jgi:hypothetical protein
VGVRLHEDLLRLVTGRAIPTWSISWKAWRPANVLGREPLTAINGQPARIAVAMPVIELVWSGLPVTSDSAGLGYTRARASRRG